MEFDFTGVCKLTLQHNAGEETSKHVSTKFYLEVSENLDINKYEDQLGLPTEEASKIIMNVFIQGLAANINLADSKGWISKEDHLKKIMAELKRTVEKKAVVSVTNFKGEEQEPPKIRDMELFVKLYNQAVKNQHPDFMYDGVKVLTKFAKYVIEYHESKYPGDLKTHIEQTVHKLRDKEDL